MKLFISFLLPIYLLCFVSIAQITFKIDPGSYIDNEWIIPKHEVGQQQSMITLSLSNAIWKYNANAAPNGTFGRAASAILKRPANMFTQSNANSYYLNIANGYDCHNASVNQPVQAWLLGQSSAGSGYLANCGGPTCTTPFIPIPLYYNNTINGDLELRLFKYFDSYYWETAPASNSSFTCNYNSHQNSNNYIHRIRTPYIAQRDTVCVNSDSILLLSSTFDISKTRLQISKDGNNFYELNSVFASEIVTLFTDIDNNGSWDLFIKPQSFKFGCNETNKLFIRWVTEYGNTPLFVSKTKEFIVFPIPTLNLQLGDNLGNCIIAGRDSSFVLLESNTELNKLCFESIKWSFKDSISNQKTPVYPVQIGSSNLFRLWVESDKMLHIDYASSWKKACSVQDSLFISPSQAKLETKLDLGYCDEDSALFYFTFGKHNKNRYPVLELKNLYTNQTFDPFKVPLIQNFDIHGKDDKITMRALFYDTLNKCTYYDTVIATRLSRSLSNYEVRATDYSTPNKLVLTKDGCIYGNYYGNWYLNGALVASKVKFLNIDNLPDGAVKVIIYDYDFSATKPFCETINFELLGDNEQYAGLNYSNMYNTIFFKSKYRAINKSILVKPNFTNCNLTFNDAKVFILSSESFENGIHLSNSTLKANNSYFTIESPHCEYEESYMHSGIILSNNASLDTFYRSYVDRGYFGVFVKGNSPTTNTKEFPIRTNASNVQLKVKISGSNFFNCLYGYYQIGGVANSSFIRNIYAESYNIVAKDIDPRIKTIAGVTTGNSYYSNQKIFLRSISVFNALFGIMSGTTDRLLDVYFESIGVVGLYCSSGGFSYFGNDERYVYNLNFEGRSIRPLEDIDITLASIPQFEDFIFDRLGYRLLPNTHLLNRDIDSSFGIYSEQTPPINRLYLNLGRFTYADEDVSSNKHNIAIKAPNPKIYDSFFNRAYCGIYSDMSNGGHTLLIGNDLTRASVGVILRNKKPGIDSATIGCNIFGRGDSPFAGQMAGIGLISNPQCTTLVRGYLHRQAGNLWPVSNSLSDRLEPAPCANNTNNYNANCSNSWNADLASWVPFLHLGYDQRLEYVRFGNEHTGNNIQSIGNQTFLRSVGMGYNSSNPPNRRNPDAVEACFGYPVYSLPSLTHTFRLRTDIAENEISTVAKVYPNPFNDFIEVSNEFQLPLNTKVVLRNGLGQVIQELDCSYKTQIRISTEGFSTGAYILTILTPTTTQTFKLIK